MVMQLHGVETMAKERNNYTLGRGEIYFGRFLASTQTPEGERYLGNTPEYSLTIESEDLDHFDSDRGIREKDDSIVLEVTRSGSLITDNIVPANVALFFFGDASTVTTTAAASLEETFAAVIQGLFYQLGQTTANPVGVRGVETVVVAPAGGGTAFILDTDYEIDVDLGRIQILNGGAIASGTGILVTYGLLASTNDRVISGSQAVEGSLRFIAFNPKGSNFDYFMPWVKLSPNGDYALKGEEWQQIPFTLEVLKKTGLEAIYMDGRPKFI
jgi:hypothetical protein